MLLLIFDFRFDLNLQSRDGKGMQASLVIRGSGNHGFDYLWTRKHWQTVNALIRGIKHSFRLKKHLSLCKLSVLVIIGSKILRNITQVNSSGYCIASILISSFLLLYFSAHTRPSTGLHYQRNDKKTNIFFSGKILYFCSRILSAAETTIKLLLYV